MAKTRETATSAKAEKREKAVEVEVKAKKATVADPLGDLFEVGTWRGRPRWQCRVCPWDTLKGEGAVREHIVSVHLIHIRPLHSPPPMSPARFGVPIQGEDSAGEGGE